MNGQQNIDQLSERFESLFMELYHYRQHNPTSTVGPTIYPTLMANTFIIQLKNPPTQTPLPAPPVDTSSIILEETYIEAIPALKSNLFPSIPPIPQFTAEMINALTPQQLTYILAQINMDLLSEAQRTQIEAIKATIKPKKSIQSDSKNIPKNFTKAMFTYAMNAELVVLKVLAFLQMQDSQPEFMEWLKDNKRNVHNTKQLRQLNQSGDKFSAPFKLLQQHFLNKDSVCYIFNSRIENTPAHLKARENIKKQLFAP